MATIKIEPEILTDKSVVYNVIRLDTAEFDGVVSQTQIKFACINKQHAQSLAEQLKKVSLVDVVIH